jgi:hypothetical protein
MNPRRAVTIISCCFSLCACTYPVLAQSLLPVPEKTLSSPPSIDSSATQQVMLPDLRIKIAAPDLINDQKTTQQCKAFSLTCRRAFKSLYNTPKTDEREEIRAQWEETLGIDVWFPYYKAKEIENTICEKASIKIHRLKGKPKWEGNRILYIFKLSF